MVLMYRTHETAGEMVCHLSMGNDLESPKRCLGRGCSAWREGIQPAERMTGLKPEGEGWLEKSTTGVGGAATQVTRWERLAGWCGHIGRPSER